MRPVAGTAALGPGLGIGLVEGTAVAGRIPAVAGHMALLVVHAGIHREPGHRTAGYSPAVGSPAAAGRSSPGLVAEVGSPAAGNRPVPILAVGEGIGLEAGIAGSLGCTGRKGRT